jgi:DNA adenine methylase
VKKSNNQISGAICVPFLKWAGGKRWLVSEHASLFPSSYRTYFEPFLGSGASYFHLRPSQAVLSDANSDLINAYRVIRSDWKQVSDRLNFHHKKHCKEHYYSIRSQSFDDPIEKAAQLIYLNRTCWNGLYRVNLKGKFNVPIGTKTNVVLDTDNFEKISKLLQGASIKNEDFETVISLAGKGDFIFVDPPYTVRHNFNGFVKYNEKLFSWEDQVRLRDCVRGAIKRGAKVLLTNADHEDVRDLYSGMGTMISLDRLSVISGSNAARGTYSELVIKCF